MQLQNRRDFMKAAVGAAALATAGPAIAKAQSAKKPNLLYVFADQLRYQSCGYAGDKNAHTPNIDAFSRQSVNFQNAVATAPVCTAYRAGLMTGKYTTSNGMVINELRINPNQRCFGHALTDGGYETGYVGKWHLYANQLGHHLDPKNSFVPRGPNRLGFDGYWAAYNFHHNYYNAYYHTESPEKIFCGPSVFEPDAQTNLAIDFIDRKAKGDKPFALFVSWGPPHDPWGDDNTPKDCHAMFADVPMPNPPNYKAENDPYSDAWGRLSPAERGQLENWRRNYSAQTAALDRNFARLLAALDKAGLADDTIVVFTSDHGEMFGAHGRRAKNIFYEEACRIPFLLRSPGQANRGMTTDVCLGTVDIQPTLLSMLKLPLPAGLQGMDLSHCAMGKPGPEPDAAMMMITGATADWSPGFEWRALRDKQYTYAIYRRDRSELLFNHATDPHQMANLVNDAAHADALGRFRKLLAAKMDAIHDTFESSPWYRDHWTDGNRNIVRSATADWSSM
jgi:arylsulfatase A-like enzyme